jgi:hypothetical protein
VALQGQLTAAEPGAAPDRLQPCVSLYRAYASFERDLPRERIKAMVDEWLEKSFTKARIVYAIHRDSGHTHVHFWMDSRQEDGKKVQLSEREYRRLDETWNRIYSREMGRDEREHLAKKERTLAYKQARVRVQEAQRPERVKNSSREMADYVVTLREEASSAGRRIEQMSARYEQLTAYVESLRGWIGKRRRVPAPGGMRSGAASELRPWSP